MITEAVLLCGGKGTRLRPLTENVPKALIEYRGKTLLEWQIEWLMKNGVKRIILATGFMSEKIEEFVKTLGYEAEILVSREYGPAGTAGALRLAMDFVHNSRVIVANVDCLNDIDLRELSDHGNVMCLAQARLPFGVVITEVDIVRKFDEKPLLEDVWINSGIYILERNLDLPEKGSLEYDVFPNILMHAHRHKSFWKAVDTLKDIE